MSPILRGCFFEACMTIPFRLIEQVTVDIKKCSDEELIALILESGAMELFSELYDRYGNKVYRKVISMVKDLEMSKDLTQEILVKAFLSLAKFEGKSKFSTWIYMVTYNYCIDFLRKKKRKLERETDLNEKTTEDYGEYEEESEHEILEMELDRLSRLLEMIPTEDKTMLLMYYQDEMSVKELQGYFDLGASAVKMRLSRTRKKLKNLYHENYGGL